MESHTSYFQSQSKNPKKLDEFFNKAAERLVGKRRIDNGTLQSYISSLKHE